LELPLEISQKEAEDIILSNEKIISLLGGVQPKKVIFVKGKMLNLVT
jgi:leucyl-tRNA synthetase